MSSRKPGQAAGEPQAAETLRAAGAALRDERLARGETLEQVASRLRIRLAYLKALEAGDHASLPGRPYVLGFVRSYAVHLGFDGDEVVEVLRQALEPCSGPASLAYSSPEREERRPGGLLIAASILVAGALYLGWQMSGRRPGVLDQVAEMPAELGRYAAGMLEEPLPRVTAPAPAAPSAPAPAAPPPAVTETPPEVPAMLHAAGEPVERTTPEAARTPPAPVAPAATPASAPAASAAPADAASAVAAELPQPGEQASAGELLAALGGGRPAPGAEEGRVVLQARESSWIQVRSSSRDFVRTLTLEPGERLALPERDDLALWTGNAGGLEIVLDGRSLGTLGAPGKVVRDVALEPGALRERFATAR